MRVLGRAFLAILIVTIFFVPLTSADNANEIPNTTPFIIIDPIGNHTVGDVFFINGTTNLPANRKSVDKSGYGLQHSFRHKWKILRYRSPGIRDVFTSNSDLIRRFRKGKSVVC